MRSWIVRVMFNKIRIYFCISMYHFGDPCFSGPTICWFFIIPTVMKHRRSQNNSCNFHIRRKRIKEFISSISPSVVTTVLCFCFTIVIFLSYIIISTVMFSLVTITCAFCLNFRTIANALPLKVDVLSVLYFSKGLGSPVPKPSNSAPTT